MKQITQVEFEGLNYQFTDTSPLTKDDENYLNSQFRINSQSNAAFKTSMRIKKSVLWELELISRISTIRNIDNNKTFGDIIDNLLRMAYHSDKVKDRDLVYKNLLMPKKFLRKLFFLENGNREIFTLPELTFDHDFIIRTLKLAIYDKHLLSNFEKRLLHVLLTTEDFVESTFKSEKMEFVYDPDDFSDWLVAFLRNEAKFNWYKIFDFFGLGSPENFIQGRVNLLELSKHNNENLIAEGWLAYKWSRKNLIPPDQYKYDQLDEEQQKQYLISRAKDEHYMNLSHWVEGDHGNYEHNFRKDIQLKRKQGDFSTYI